MTQAPNINVLPKIIIRPGSEWESMEPGLYRDVPEEVYHATRVCSNSQLSKLAEEPPESLKWQFDHPEEDESEAREFGQWAHACILEPERFERQFDMAGQCAAITGKGTRCTSGGGTRVDGKWYCGTHIKKIGGEPDEITAIPEAKYEQLMQMCERCYRHPMIGRMLRLPSERELSALWVHKETGLLCKMRIDLYAPGPAFLSDYKTFRKVLTEENMKWEIHYRGYHRQAVMYLSGCKALNLPLEDYAIIFQQKAGPYYARLRRIDDAALRVGVVQVRELLEKYAATVAKGLFPGFDDGDDIHPIGLPDKVLDYDLSEAERSAINYGSITL